MDNLSRPYRVVGVDPGIQGGFFLLENGIPKSWSIMPTKKVDAGFVKVRGRLKLDEKGNKIKKYKTSVDARQIVLILREYDPDKVFIERVHAFSGQGVTSMFSFGSSFGVLLGAVGGLDRCPEAVLIDPKAWQKVMFEGFPSSDTKEIAAKVVSKLWPQLDLRKSKRAKKLHDGICDAACLAEYGYRILLEGSSA